MKKFMAEFKEFISRGNVMDFAVGVIIGGAFGAIVTSLCNDIIMPVIQLIISKALGVESIDEMTKVLNVGPIAFGNFISAVINFLIMALIIFLMVKAINKLMTLKKKEERRKRPTTKVCPFCCSRSISTLQDAPTAPASLRTQKNKSFCNMKKVSACILSCLKIFVAFGEQLFTHEGQTHSGSHTDAFAKRCDSFGIRRKLFGQRLCPLPVYQTFASYKMAKFLNSRLPKVSPLSLKRRILNVYCLAGHLREILRAKPSE